MIELITGTPGAGKTTFAVALRLALESLRFITAEGERAWWDDAAAGVTEPIQRRLVVAGFRGLTLDHEKLPHKLTGERTPATEVDEWNKMLDDDAPVHQRLPGEPPRDVPAIVQNWWLWCKPGDLIAIDEAQFVAPRGTMGRKPPYWIQCMEIHRHYGVDFLIVTQHPGLIDTTIRALVGMHRHVRSVLGSPLCMVYVWDHASNPERYSLANKEKFIRRAKHYKLFHSSVAHIKPPTSGRSTLVIAGLLMCLGVAGFWHKVGGMINAKASPPTSAQASPGAQGVVAEAKVAPEGPKRPAGFADVPQLAGCWAQGDMCGCIDRAGRRVRVAFDMCRVSSSSYDGLVAWEPRPTIKGEGYGAAAQPGVAASAVPAKVL